MNERTFFSLSAITNRVQEILQPYIGKLFWVKAEISSGRERGGSFYCDYQVPVTDVIRYLMYGRCYGELERAKSAFKEIPSDVRNRMCNMDYKEAERECPHNLPIGRLMQEAVIELA